MLFRSDFCRTIGVTNQGYFGKITNPAELHDLYSRLRYQHKKTKQRSKTSCFQHPAVRYFAYYLYTGVLARESTSTTPSPDLAIMLAAVDKNYSFSVGAQIARRIDNNSVKGRTLEASLPHAFSLLKLQYLLILMMNCCPLED